MTHDFSAQQAKARDAVAHWFKHDARKKQIFRLFGYAGTGKTTLARHLAEDVEGEVFYAALTGKAAMVMQENGCDGASTIHRLIYETRKMPNGGGEFRLDPCSPAANAALIILDECSMVDKPLARDLMSFKTPILVLGDPAQLPPVKGTGYFINADPDVMLTEVHRQARDSPILRLAAEVRAGRRPAIGNYGACRVIAMDDCDMDDILAADQVLAYRNSTCHHFNHAIRHELGYTTELPGPGDRLLCLKNHYDIDIFNGETVRVTSPPRASKYFETVSMKVARDTCGTAEDVRIRVHPRFFTDEQESLTEKQKRESHQFGYGYVMTVHKAQGSQWDNVLILDESRFVRDDASAWLYTAITRARERLTLVI
jgi:exodeoxyribonuclease-5